MASLLLTRGLLAGRGGRSIYYSLRCGGMMFQSPQWSIPILYQHEQQRRHKQYYSNRKKKVRRVRDLVYEERQEEEQREQEALNEHMLKKYSNNTDNDGDNDGDGDAVDNELEYLKKINPDMTTANVTRDVYHSLITALSSTDKYRADLLFKNTEAKLVGCFKSADEVPAMSKIQEIVVIGRSNVGKSSLLQRLMSGNLPKGTVPVSGRPGFTRSINLYATGAHSDVTGELVLVDMPGYGFRSRVEWMEAMGNYMIERNIVRTLVLIDCRRGISTNDRLALELLEEHNIAYQLILTKTDLVSPAGLNRIWRTLDDFIREELPNCIDVVLSTSSKDLNEKTNGLSTLRFYILEACGLLEPEIRKEDPSSPEEFNIATNNFTQPLDTALLQRHRERIKEMDREKREKREILKGNPALLELEKKRRRRKKLKEKRLKESIGEIEEAEGDDVADVEDYSVLKRKVTEMDEKEFQESFRDFIPGKSPHGDESIDNTDLDNYENDERDLLDKNGVPKVILPRAPPGTKARSKELRQRIQQYDDKVWEIASKKLANKQSAKDSTNKYNTKKAKQNRQR